MPRKTIPTRTVKLSYKERVLLKSSLKRGNTASRECWRLQKLGLVELSAPGSLISGLQLTRRGRLLRDVLHHLQLPHPFVEPRSFPFLGDREWTVVLVPDTRTYSEPE